MQLLGSIMGQFIGVGVLALIIVFHPEIRKFLVFIGTNYNVNKVFSLDKLFGTHKPQNYSNENLEILTDVSFSMAKSKTGALIVIAGHSELNEQIGTGEILNADISSSLIRTIFFKNTPLHDGAVIIKSNKIVSAGSILPLTQRDLDQTFGLRHRAAIGITENTDAVTIVISEERGTVSFAKNGELHRNITREILYSLLEEALSDSN